MVEVRIHADGHPDGHVPGHARLRCWPCTVSAIVLNGRTRVAATTTVLTAIYPVWFAQSTLAHADMFAAAATLWGLVFVFPGRRQPSSPVGGGGLLCRGRVV